MTTWRLTTWRLKWTDRNVRATDAFARWVTRNFRTWTGIGITWHMSPRGDRHIELHVFAARTP